MRLLASLCLLLLVPYVLAQWGPLRKLRGGDLDTEGFVNSTRLPAPTRELDGGPCKKRPATIKLKRGDMVRVTSPGYAGGGYTNNLDCYWRFKAPRRAELGVYCSDVHLRQYDYIIVSGTFVRVRRDNMAGGPYSVHLKRRSGKVGIKTNAKYTAKGFTCVVAVWGKCKCGQVNRASRVISGHQTEENEYPWQAALLYPDVTGPYCGGSIINTCYILTAAQCSLQKDTALLKVFLGGHEVSKMSYSSARQIDSFTRHPRFDVNTLRYDVALVKLLTALDFSVLPPSIRPVCLAVSSSAVTIGATAVVTGWGTTTVGGSKATSLQEAEVTLISQYVCKIRFPIHLASDHLCAFTQGKRPCDYDAGGALVIPLSSGSSYYQQIGITSWGAKCEVEFAPTVYSRISASLAWITRKSSSGSYCDRP